MANINQRNKQLNFKKALDNVGHHPGGQQAGKEGQVDMFSRRHTRSTVYWNTKRDKGEGRQRGNGVCTCISLSPCSS